MDANGYFHPYRTFFPGAHSIGLYLQECKNRKFSTWMRIEPWTFWILDSTKKNIGLFIRLFNDIISTTYFIEHRMIVLLRIVDGKNVEGVRIILFKVMS